MKKIVLFTTAVLLSMAGTAMADSIAGKVGITARGGASYVFDSEWTDDMLHTGEFNKEIKPDIGWTGGVGIMYGITDNLSVNFDVIYLQAALDASKVDGTKREVNTAKTVDFALGAQWRFLPKSKFVPYIGAGIDVMWNKWAVYNNSEEYLESQGIKVDVDYTYGAHLSVGTDFFITPNIALNAEIRGLYSTKGDVTVKQTGHADLAYAEYNPTNISGFVGIRFFFGGPKEASQPMAKEVAPEAAAEVEQQIIEKGRITLKVEFDTGKAIVKQDYYKEIERVANIMKKYPELNIVIEGHTDNMGGEKYNLNLSQKRTESIKEVMVKNYKIESARITPKGFGYSKPVADNATKEGRKSNRRVEASLEYTIKK